MIVWSDADDEGARDILDMVTDFRLSRLDHHYPEGKAAQWWTVLLQLRDTTLDGFARVVIGAGFGDDLLVPSVYDAEDRQRRLDGQPVTILARAALINFLNDRASRDPISHLVEALHLGGAVPVAWIDRNAIAPPVSPRVVEEGTVVMAVIDDGLAIAQDLFRSAKDQTRIEYSLIFEARPRPAPDNQSSIGRVLDGPSIDAMLRQNSFAGTLDELRFYERAGCLDLSTERFSTIALRRSHGTHVMALAAGYDAVQPPPAERPILCAALPNRMVRDTTGLDLLPILNLAFHALSKQAARYVTADGAPVPVITNFSFGNNSGPHDGTGVFSTVIETAMSGIMSRPRADAQSVAGVKHWMTLPAGNSHDARMHAAFRPEVRQSATLYLTVLPDDHTPTLVEIWMPRRPCGHDNNMARIEVTAPFGTRPGVITTAPGQKRWLRNADGNEVGRLVYQFVEGSTQRGCVRLMLNPTANQISTRDLAPSGDWRVRITSLAHDPGDEINLWIRRDETIGGGGSGGRQAEFALPPEGGADPVSGSGTLSGFACGASPIVVAAYREAEALISDYSAAGPLCDNADRTGPDLTAKGDDSRVRKGVLGAGSCSGSWVRLSGTSVAAPQVARLAAAEIAAATVPGRVWSCEAVQRHRFNLEASYEPVRIGAGAVAVPLWDAPDGD